MIPKLHEDLSIIQKLDDQPNDVGGLTAAELKAKFDESGLTVQEYINNKMCIRDRDGAEGIAAGTVGWKAGAGNFPGLYRVD